MSADDLETYGCGDLENPCRNCDACDDHLRHLMLTPNDRFRRLVNRRCVWCQNPWPQQTVPSLAMQSAYQVSTEQYRD
jgi:hypothetical protein